MLKGLLKWILVLLLLGGIGGSIFWSIFQKALDQPITEGSAQVFKVKRGDSFRSIVNKLESEKILEQPFWFQLLTYMEGSQGQLKAGEYEILAGITTRQLLAQLIEGKSLQYSLTFLEGWAFKQVLSELSRHPELQQTLAGSNYEQIMTLLGSPQSYPEGWFYPDTYFFSQGDRDLTLLKRAYQKMQTTLAEEWRQRDTNLPVKTPYEALILASIVEKETGRANERARIAGVFQRRLKKGMRLQTDPTVIYGMGKRYKGNIRRRDLREDTPYNTYVHKGLPPTPIAMPGGDAIHAVLHPDLADSSLFFVANGEGGHIFSTTLQEHNRAVNQYQRKRKKP